jgi:hypothetical protein
MALPWADSEVPLSGRQNEQKAPRCGVCTCLSATCEHEAMWASSCAQGDVGRLWAQMAIGGGSKSNDTGKSPERWFFEGCGAFDPQGSSRQSFRKITGVGSGAGSVVFAQSGAGTDDASPC